MRSFVLVFLIFVTAIPRSFVKVYCKPDFQLDWTRARSAFLFPLWLKLLILQGPGQTIFDFFGALLIVAIATLCGWLLGSIYIEKYQHKELVRRKDPPSREDEDYLYHSRLQFDWSRNGMRKKVEYLLPGSIGLALGVCISLIV